MTDNELPGMWEKADFEDGADEVRVPSPEECNWCRSGRTDCPRHTKKVTDHAYDAGPTKGDRCLYNCGRPEEGHANTEYAPGETKSKAVLASKSTDVVRAADAAQYAREAIPEDQRGQIRVRLLNATPDPLGSIAALCKQYKGEVVRSLSEVTDKERREYLADMGKTVLNGPLEVAQFHFQIEGVTRSTTHQMVRSRASFFAQESLRFAVPKGDWAEEIPLPPSLSGKLEVGSEAWNAKRAWDNAMGSAQIYYQRLIDLGVPAEEARGVLPHDMPTRIHWVCDLRTLLAEAGKRTCTQAQFPWRLIFAGIANELRNWGSGAATVHRPLKDPLRVSGDGWQFSEIANRMRPVCYQTGSCGFMAKFDRSCSIRSRVDANTALNRPSKKWGHRYHDPERGITIEPINDAEWALDPGAARS